MLPTCCKPKKETLWIHWFTPVNWIHAQILFNMFRNIGRIFFQAVLVGCFFKERMLNKQLLYISRNIKTRRFSFRDEAFIWKILSRLCRDPAYDEMIVVLCIMIVAFWCHLLFCSGSHINSPLVYLFLFQNTN